MILQDLDKKIPDDAKVRFFDATEDIAKEMGFGDLAYLSAQPTAVLGIVGGTKSEREIKIVTILRPVSATISRLGAIACSSVRRPLPLFSKQKFRKSADDYLEEAEQLRRSQNIQERLFQKN
jgi:hypothetical protein